MGQEEDREREMVYLTLTGSILRESLVGGEL